MLLSLLLGGFQEAADEPLYETGYYTRWVLAYTSRNSLTNYHNNDFNIITTINNTFLCSFIILSSLICAHGKPEG